MSKDLIRKNFGAIWPGHVANFVELLISCRRAIGDLDLVLVLAAIGDRSMSPRRTEKNRNHRELFVEWTGRPEPEGINAQSISDYTGIPRETVRRKIIDLMDRGWIEKQDGNFSVTKKCADDLSATTEDGINYLARMLEMFNGLK